MRRWNRGLVENVPKKHHLKNLASSSSLVECSSFYNLSKKCDVLHLYGRVLQNAKLFEEHHGKLLPVHDNVVAIW